MKFICAKCRRDFDIGAPKGMQLPCPACGGMLVDEETVAAAPRPAQAAPPPPQVTPPAPVEEEISLDAAEAFARRSSAPQAAPAPEPVPPPAPPVEQAESEWSFNEQELLAGTQVQPEEEQGQEPQPMPAEPQVAPTEELPAEVPAPAPQAGWTGEEEASPTVLIAGWVLFGVSVVGICLLAYFLKNAHDQLKKGVIPREFHERLIRLEKERKEAIERAEALDKKREELQAKLDELDAQARASEKKQTELEDSAKKASEMASKLEAELAATARTLRDRETELREVRKNLEEETANAARLAKRVSAAIYAGRAAELLDRPARRAEAAALLESAIKASEDFDDPYLLRGILLMRLRRGEEALADLEKADELARRLGANAHVRACVLAGDCAWTLLSDKERAAGFYRRATAAGGGSSWGLLAEAKLARLQGRTESARQIAADAIKSVEASGGDATPLRLELATILSGLGPSSRRAALGELDKVIASDPVCLEALDLRGRLLLEEGLREAAAYDLARASELEPSNAMRFLLLGKVMLELKRPANAVPALRRALSLPNLPPEAAPEARTELGRALVLLGKHEEAIRELGAVLAASPGNVAALRARGEARAAVGDYRTAIQDLEDALRLGVDDVKVRVLLANIYAAARDARFRDPKKALDNARVAVELTESKNAEALAALAVAYAASGDYTRAAVEMRKAVLLDPANEAYRTALRTYESRAK